MRRGQSPSAGTSAEDLEKAGSRPAKWSLGILNDKETDEVPGSVLLLSKVAKRNEPLGLQNAPARTSASSLPSPYPPSLRSRTSRQSMRQEKKRTPDGKIVLEPQPDESKNDPLNWAPLRRDAALLSLGFYCMLGGGMTPILAAGYNDVASTYNVNLQQVSLTTGLYMMGLGIGSVIASPTAILYGKRPVYLVAVILFILSAVWCALSPNYPSLLVARIVQGLAVSPVECLPSASVAEIFFLHERAYRLGIYTLLLLGGKNLIPLVSAAIVESLGWRWVFWIVAIVVGFAGVLLFLFVPETFWDRTPRPHQHHKKLRSGATSPAGHGHKMPHLFSHGKQPKGSPASMDGAGDTSRPNLSIAMPSTPGSIDHRRRTKNAHVGFADDKPASLGPPHGLPSTLSSEVYAPPKIERQSRAPQSPGSPARHLTASPVLSEKEGIRAAEEKHIDGALNWHYTDHYRAAPPKTYLQTLKPYSGRLIKDNWFRVAVRPFILFAYPSVLWSTVVYSLSVGWLIVLSESVAVIYRTRDTYNFTALQTGLVYISPFVGGVLGTAVAGKFSDVIVRFMSRRNDGVYEPEFRLIMAIPVAICTTLGLMGFGWAAQERDAWIVPTIFFGIISFGCCVGSTTAITFCVDSYRQYAGEALVTLNFSKNIFHGLVFSLFFTRWLESDGAKTVFVVLGGIQMGFMLFTIPMYIYGKRMRMWTVRKNLMEKF
ncbi:MFS general substrate transporter [Saccharata proteae CBS 121410]|uniref:MFS general substrate transporter n=1 Tax=Saccharata proteae CBS 121410 TaxID=1314787 RepID=A0A9P4HY45_9PEZI|nr:MFS general substrate transporter [Saccharata proteae CBS 121410]